MFDTVQLDPDLLSLDIPHIRKHPLGPEISEGKSLNVGQINCVSWVSTTLKECNMLEEEMCFLPLGKLVGGEGSGVIGWQRDQVVEDPGTLVIVDGCDMVGGR